MIVWNVSMRVLVLLFIACVVDLTAFPVLAADAEPSFNRDVRPILAAKCFACHGPDEEQREGDLRLDDRQAALDAKAFVPGKPDKSELVRRIFSTDESEQMPPRDSKKTLTDKERHVLQRWIAAGAKYETHWAFVRPKRPRPPSTKLERLVRNDIDRFVFARLEAEGVAPARMADRYSLIRRVSLDLIGLPPTPAQADSFAADKDPQAYEKLVDRLLASQSYGEHWTQAWLDLARYADTNGYEKDRPRSIWPYRDWVIRALNADMPYDQFTIEQLAGDMLPQATAAQRIATGFHRNTMLNEEGGIDPLEFRFYAMVDRVATTGTVWLGLTTGCAQCHSHKYDPISHTDYYRLMALLNNADEPDFTVPDAAIAARRQTLRKQIEKLETALPNEFPPGKGEGTAADRRRRHFEQKYSTWLAYERKRSVKWKTLQAKSLASNLPKLQQLADGSIFSSGDITKRDVFSLTFDLKEVGSPITALRLEVLPDERLPAGGPGRAYYEGRKGDFFLSELTATIDRKPVTFSSASHSYGKISIGNGGAAATNVIDGKGSTGWSTSGREGKPSQLVLNFNRPIQSSGPLKIELLFERHFAASLGRFRLSVANAASPITANKTPVEIEQLLTRDATSWKKDEEQQLRRQFVRVAPELAVARKKIDGVKRKLPSFPQTMVLHERSADNPRLTFRRHRGEYLSPRERIEPGLPTIFGLDRDTQPKNRLELARWLVSASNTLAARVAVNRAWQAFFGIGFVRSSEDLGTQSEPPSHPELLDWLATEFVRNGWSMKHVHRTIVTSATYQQSSHTNAGAFHRDPDNRLLARGSRFRVNAGIVRDVMLSSSGLLTKTMYGPSVFPPQPSDVTALAYGNTKWQTSTGKDRYRRSLYTFSKRTAPFAAYSVFDAPTGESCVVRRYRSNTPLQALTLLNDEMYLEMAKALASRALTDHPKSRRACATAIFRRLLTRQPQRAELDLLLNFQQRQQTRLQRGELNAVAIGGKQATPDLAAWIMTARAVMNLDETITRP